MEKLKILRLYEKNEHLAKYYASKVFNEHHISLEREDVVQELRIRLWSAIETYLRNYKQYKKTGIAKPVPLKYYLKTVMINKVKDFIREINAVPSTVSMSDIQFDYGQEDFNVEVDFRNKRVMVGLTDILHDVPEDEKKFFMLYLKGFPISKINKINKSGKSAKNSIKKNIEKMRQWVPELLEEAKIYKVVSHCD
jgi:RNA polymerase sigma factor (sigma-70 family)